MKIIPAGKPEIEKIRSNIIESAHEAIFDWETFPWHRGSKGQIDTMEMCSSQALAIELFGTIKKSEKCDVVMDEFAKQKGLPIGGKWEIELEWTDDSNLLNERRKSQIDAIARNNRTLIFFECKFTETNAGTCSQPKPLQKGPDKGFRQCSGDYKLQTNPVSGKVAQCALTAKGIRYWESIPKVFKFRSDMEYRPCPFSGSWFQWMRNLVLCYECATSQDLTPAFFVIYAASKSLPMSKKINSDEWNKLTGNIIHDKIKFGICSYQEFASKAIKATSNEPRFVLLKERIDNKIQKVTHDLKKVPLHKNR
jgi:hypothetical protein